MFYGKRQLILTCIAAILAGTVLHFVYDWMPCAITALISPINESLWEHTKIIFWPYLAAAILLNHDRPGGIYPWLLTLPALCAIMLLTAYLYHIPLHGDRMWVDIGIFVAVMVLGFWLPVQMSTPFSAGKKVISILMTLVLFLMIVGFTLYPPKMLLFQELSSYDQTTGQTPCCLI